MYYSIIMVSHVLLAVSMVLLILLQRGKGAEAGTAFGAGASGTVFGSRGSASFLTRTTGVLATLFFVTSLSLTFLGAQRPTPTSVMEAVPPTAAVEEPQLMPSVDGLDLPALPTLGADGPAEAETTPEEPEPPEG